MELSFEEIAVYLHCGRKANRELRRRTMELADEAPLQPRGIFLRDGDKFLLCGTVGGALLQFRFPIRVLGVQISKEIEPSRVEPGLLRRIGVGKTECLR